MVNFIFFISIFHLGYSFRVPYETIQFYKTVAIENEIYPPILEYGYPLFYQNHFEKHPKVLFFKNEVPGDYIKVNDSSYILEPIPSNLYLITEFCGESNSTFYIIPDSNATCENVFNFCDSLTRHIGYAQFLFCSSNMNYCRIHSKHSNNFGCGIRNVIHIMKNSNNEYIVDGEFKDKDSINSYLYRFYKTNLHNINQIDKYSPKANDYTTFYKKNLENEYVFKKEVMPELINSNEMKILDIVINEMNCSKNDRIIVSNYHEIKISIQSRTAKISEQYEHFNMVYNALYKIRSEVALGTYGYTYDNLFALNQFQKIVLIDYSIKDMIHRELMEELPSPSAIILSN